MKDLDVMNDKINDANADIDSPLDGMLDEKGNLTFLGREVLGIDGYLGDGSTLGNWPDAIEDWHRARHDAWAAEVGINRHTGVPAVAEQSIKTAIIGMMRRKYPEKTFKPCAGGNA
jgi:hypothetical protein